MEIKTSLEVYPNPVSNSTTITFPVEQSQHVEISIYDLNGRLVTMLTDASFEKGNYEMTWNAADVNAGIYFLQFQSGENQEKIKLVVTK